MSQAMRKITYYENILEFKENTKEELYLNEINNWQLCRTCLTDTREDDVDLEKLSVMDVMQGSFLSIMEMLVETTSLNLSSKENLPLKVCKDCFSKITTLYYFSIQVRKADNILKRLASKVKECGECSDPLEPNETDEKEVIPENVKSNDGILENKAKENDEKNNFKENDIPDDIMVIEIEELFDFPEDIETLENVAKNITTDQNKALKENLKDGLEPIVDDKEESLYFEEISQIETEILTDRESDYGLPSNSEEECHLENDFLEYTEIIEDDKDQESSKELITTTKQISNTVKTVKRKCNNGEVPSMSGYKHKQPRVTSPLLNDFTCAICQKNFERQHDLVHHVRNLHPNSKAYRCRVCGNRFSHIQSLSRHMNSHKEALVLNECEYCAKSFIRVDDLKRHLRIHTGERPYVCSLCDKSYQQLAELREHEKKHFGSTIYKCTKCDQTYTSRAGLYVHKRKYHKQEGAYVCSLCEKSFENKSDLKSHERKHFISQTIKCSECDEIFKSRNSFCLHQKKRHKKVIDSPKELEPEKVNEVDETAMEL